MSDMQTEIYVLDDDRLFREELVHVLRREGYAVEQFGTIFSCRKALAGHVPGVLLLDIQLSDGNGIDFLREIVSEYPRLEVVMISGAASRQEAADSMKAGAADFLEKPFEPQRLLSIVKNCMRIARLRQANETLIRDRLSRYEIIGESMAIRRLKERIRQISDTDARILITGESGTGKELVACQIHFLGRRSAGPFVAVNCSAIPSELVESELFGHEKGAYTGAVTSRKGVFALADGGTLLLDEIGDMPVSIQPKLLRAIETGEVQPVGATCSIKVDTRLISSTNRNIEKLIEEGKFRADLLYRINTVPIHVPALREHATDIPQLAEHFLDTLWADDRSPRQTLDTGAMDALMSHEWPGNVRQLKNVMERLYYTVRERQITADHVRACLEDRDLREEVASDGEFREKNILKGATWRFERRFLKNELENAGGNISRLAARLGMDRGNLYRKLKRLGLLSE